MPNEYELQGLGDFKAKLRQLSERGTRNALNRSLRKGAVVIRDEARSRAMRFDDPNTPRAIYKNITYANMSTRRVRREGNAAGIRVGVLGGARNYAAYGEIVTGRSAKGNPGGDTFYWRFLEFGTSKMRARPFMRPAMLTKQQAAFDAVAAAVDTELTKEVAKL